MKKKYLKKIDKYFSKDDLISVLKKKKHKSISLYYPFVKLKTKISLVSFRGILVIYEEDRVIPLRIFQKKDKKSGENIFWDKDRKNILEEYSKLLEDIENGDFERF